MDRYITDPELYCLSDLQNVDWDVIELRSKVNSPGLMEWYSNMSTTLEQAKWIACDEYEEKYFNPAMKRRWWAANPNKYKDKAPFWWYMNWPIERYDPLPFAFLANRDLFPEAYSDTYSDQDNPLLSKYNVGEFAELYELYGKYLKAIRTIVLPEHSGLMLHVDMPYPNVIIRLHIQLDINENCEWQFGHVAERKYVMKPGKMYLVNTAVPHSVSNFGGKDWVMIYGTPHSQDINEILRLGS